jgi:hypothetical protein
MILDPVAVLPPRVTAYGRDPGFWLDEPGTPHRDYRYVDTKLGERIIAGLANLPDCPSQEEDS